MKKAFVIEPNVVDRKGWRQAAAQARKLNLTLPTFSQLAHPPLPSAKVWEDIAAIGPDEPSAANLWRMHWYNAENRRGRDLVPGYIVLPKEITGVDAKIIVLLGNRFPMIGAHKVLPAYAALIEQLVTGRFDPSKQKAVWPSTGNYCHGGVAVSRILGCRGVESPGRGGAAHAVCVTLARSGGHIAGAGAGKSLRSRRRR